MIAAEQKYKPYPKYKDSGVEWLERIPQHWEAKRLRHVAVFNNSNVDKKSYPEQQSVQLCNYTDVYYNEFIRKGIEFMEATASDSEIEKFQLRKGQVIITKDSEDPADIGIPSLVTENFGKVICGYHLTVIFPDDYSLSRFLHRSIQSTHTRAHFYIESPGITRYGLNQNTIADVPIALPPPAEQTAIADFIERECGRMDKLVEKKQQFIALLKEKRQALITHAVTKGLNPNAKMKDSGVEWLGKVPEHWEVKRLKYLVRLQSGNFITSDSIQESDSYPVYGGNGKRGYTDQFTHEGEFLLIGRQGALCGNINYASGKFWASEHAVVGNPITTFDTFWLGELLKTMNLNQYSVSAAQPGLAVDRIASLLIPVPPSYEQTNISNHLKQQTSRIHTLIAKTEKSIDLLKERKTALITAAVTGQIDVTQSA